MTAGPRPGEPPIVELQADFGFEAAHRLPNVPPEHMCARLHGHSYRVRLTVVGPVEPGTGWVVDYADIAAAFEPLRRELDHHCLNDIRGLENPTSELLALWIWERIRPRLRQLRAVEVRETAQLGCVYRGPT